MSPVPLKKLSIAGTSILKILGWAVEVIVEPITNKEEVDAGAGSLIEVMTICGTRCFV